MLIFFLIILLGLLCYVSFDPIPIANILTVVILFIAIMYFLYLFSFGNLSEEERKKIVLILVLFFGAAFFWSGFDQAGSSFNIFAKEYTDRIILGWEYPASWLQVLNPILVVILSPFMAYMWIFLGKRMLDPSLPFKFGLGLIYFFKGVGIIIL